METEHRLLTVTTIEAEVAFVNGEAAILSQYFGEGQTPSADLVRNIAWSLLANQPSSDPGPGNWKLKFSTRDGRPPKKQEKITDAVSAIANGQAIPLGQYLLAALPSEDFIEAPRLGAETKRGLAAVFDPLGVSKWRLKFVRGGGVGNPRTNLRADIDSARIGIEAQGMRDDGKLLKEIYYAMGPECRPPKESVSPTRIKAGLAMVKRAREFKRNIEKEPHE